MIYIHKKAQVGTVVSVRRLSTVVFSRSCARHEFCQTTLHPVLVMDFCMYLLVMHVARHGSYIMIGGLTLFKIQSPKVDFQ